MEFGFKHAIMDGVDFLKCNGTDSMMLFLYSNLLNNIYIAHYNINIL